MHFVSLKVTEIGIFWLPFGIQKAYTQKERCSVLQVEIYAMKKVAKWTAKL